MGGPETPKPPVPPSEAVTAARTHVTKRYATGAERLFWVVHHEPMPDLDAIKAVVAAIEVKTAEQLDLAAALVLIQAAHGELESLEKGIIETARAEGLDWQAIAAIMALDSPEEAEHRYRHLLDRTGS